MRAKEFITEKWSAKYKRSINCSDPKGFSQKAHCAGRKKNESVAEGFSNDMSTEDMIAYLRQHHDKNLHPDYINHLTNTNSKFVLKNIPLTSIRTELAGLDRAKVEKYKKQDPTKAPPIVVGSDGYILDGYHRATAVKELGIPTIRAYVGVKSQQGVAEGLLNEYRNALYDFVKSKFPTWPEYVLKDFLYSQAKHIRDEEELTDFLERNQKDFGQVKWRLEKLPITLDIFTPKTQRMIKQRAGGSSNPMQVPKDAERHAQQLKMIQQQGVRTEPIIVAKLNNGYDLIEGWHRTIQHLQQYPEGYTGPAWVAYGATYTSESKQGVTKGVPQPGESSGAPKQFGPDAKIEPRQMTVKQIISSIPGVPYYNNVVDDWDAKDYSWGVTKKVIEYATYLKDHPESLSQLPPILVLNGKFEDGAHRVSAIWLLQQRMDPKNPLWKNAKLNVQFVKQGVAENFADGKKPGRKGLAKRMGVDCSKSETELRKIARNSSGERQRMAHWCANMKKGKQK